MINRRLSENGYFPQSLRQAQIIILEILKCIPVVIISAFLDLEKNISFSDSLLWAEIGPVVQGFSPAFAPQDFSGILSLDVRHIFGIPLNFSVVHGLLFPSLIFSFLCNHLK